ncbi:BON domain-containing protein [Chroococcidiopsis sp. FACHB-1243]|uniref:BON domain-containing protein n=1 Tax=Chroococcidiopsis sp. [FACHB-1243] TaxID=2692781 RepID=UPI001786A21F|nr:BON domain-containing protein [Chroococcidiopsis sp. [FACHB-1243]]MBD2308983.1 BON domain-containing protein [Chroococcidiopsis sp. [FACHB-1243]]
MALTEIFILSFVTGTIAIVGLFLTKRNRLSAPVVLLLAIGVFICTSSRPVLAAPHFAALGADDNALTKEQKALDENLRSNPEGTQYTGLESVPKDSSGKQLNDVAIKEFILSNVRGDLAVDVTNGSVMLTGRVEDKKTARAIVEQIKQIPSVQEISFSLGLEKPTVKLMAD